MRVPAGLAVILAVALAAAGPTAAQSLDPASAAALDATLRVLQDPAQRAAAIAGSPQAAALDREMQAVLRTPELQEAFYALVGAVFVDLVQGSGGDVGRLGQALEAGRSDPAGFAARLSPATLERLRALSGKIGEQTR
jgi:hypothetical protein